MKNFNFIILITILFASCKGLLPYSKYYERDSRNSTFLKNSYQKTNFIKVSKMVLCQNRNESDIRVSKTKGDLVFNKMQIEKSIQNSFQKSFSNIIYEPNKITNWETSCNNFTKDILMNKNIIPKNETNRAYHMWISFDIDYTIEKNLDFSGFWGASTYEDIADDISKIKFKLVTSLFYNDSLIYMDNHAYNTWIRTVRGKPFYYEVPQNIIDSLVTKSLAEYKKRLQT